MLISAKDTVVLKKGHSTHWPCALFRKQCQNASIEDVGDAKLCARLLPIVSTTVVVSWY